MVLSRLSGLSLLLIGLSACASTHGAKLAKANADRTPRAIVQTYDTLAATAPVGTPREAVRAALETNGWQCWGYPVADSWIRETLSGKVLKGSVLTCQVLRGSQMNPFAKKYTAQLLFEQDKLAGIEVGLRHNAF